MLALFSVHGEDTAESDDKAEKDGYPEENLCHENSRGVLAVEDDNARYDGFKCYGDCPQEGRLREVSDDIGGDFRI